jgi:hypothetical protein
VSVAGSISDIGREDFRAPSVSMVLAPTMPVTLSNWEESYEVIAPGAVRAWFIARMAGLVLIGQQLVPTN